MVRRIIIFILSIMTFFTLLSVGYGLWEKDLVIKGSFEVRKQKPEFETGTVLKEPPIVEVLTVNELVEPEGPAMELADEKAVLEGSGAELPDEDVVPDGTVTELLGENIEMDKPEENTSEGTSESEDDGKALEDNSTDIIEEVETEPETSIENTIPENTLEPVEPESTPEAVEPVIENPETTGDEIVPENNEG